MPLYEYECDTCGHRFEVIQKFSDGPVTECPKCQGAVRKLFSSPAIQFKGSGWYITDYAKKNSTAAGGTKSEGGSGSDSKGSESKGSDSKGGDAKGAGSSEPAPRTDSGTKPSGGASS